MGGTDKARGLILADRAILKVAGAEAGHFLQNLLTNDVTGLAAGEGRYAALLTPQGKILSDMLVTVAPDEMGTGFFVDCPRALAPELLKRLTMYRLRARIAIEDKSESFAIIAAWDGAVPSGFDGPVFSDPRHPALGLRMILDAGEAERAAAALRPASPDDYEAHRIACGVPRGGVDFSYGDTFVHEANLDRLHGVNFKKGCYVGQEVVSRVEHRGTARKRVTKVIFDGARPAEGAPVTAGEINIGFMGSSVPGQGLAMLRLDKAQDAREAGTPILAGGVAIRVEPAHG